MNFLPSAFLLMLAILSSPQTHSYQLEEMEEFFPRNPHCRYSETITFRSPTDLSFYVRLKRYSAPAHYRHGRLLVIMPPTGGTNIVDRSYAKMFCGSGYNAVIIDHWTGMNEYSGIESHQEEIDDSQMAFDTIMAHLPHDQVGILGTSKGAIGASVITRNHLHRIDAIFLIAGGSPLPLAISRAGQKQLKALRRERMENYQLSTQEDYDRLIDQHISHSTIASLPEHIQTAMVIATKDSIVPTELQENLRRQWDIQKVWRVPAGHKATILGGLNVRKRIPLDFFNEVLPQKDAASDE